MRVSTPRALQTLRKLAFSMFGPHKLNILAASDRLEQLVGLISSSVWFELGAFRTFSLCTFPLPAALLASGLPLLRLALLSFVYGESLRQSLPAVSTEGQLIV